MADFLDVSTEIRSGGALASDIGRTLLLSRSGVPTDYTDSKDVRRILGFTEHTSTDDISDSDLEDPADVYFGQDPYPRALLIGYRLNTGVNHIAVGTKVGAITNISGLGDNAGDGLLINGVAMPDGDGDFSGVMAKDGSTDAGDGDHALETLINAASGYSGVVVYYDTAEDVYVITSSNSFGAGFSGPVAKAYGLDDATIYPAIADNETYAAALTRLDNQGADFGWVVPATSIVDDSAAAAALRSMAGWVNARNKAMVFDSFGAGPLVTNESVSDTAIISALKQNRVGAIYNGAVIDHKAIGYVALFSAVNYLGTQTIISGSHKKIQGVTANKFTATEKTELQRKRVNYYEQDGGLTYTREGWTFGTWMDVQAFANWFNGRVELELFNTLAEADVAQSDDDLSIVQALTTVCELAVQNGAIGPGDLSPRSRGDVISVTDDQDFEGFLPRGYYIWKGKYKDQSSADRTARKSVAHTIWMVGRGFVNAADIRAIFQP